MAEAALDKKNPFVSSVPMIKRLSLQAFGKKAGQYGGNVLKKQSFMPQNPWILPAAKAVVGFVGATYGKGDVIVPIAEGLFQSAIEDAMDQLALMAGVPLEDDPYEQVRQLQAAMEQMQLAADNRGRVTPSLPTGNTGINPPPLDKLKVPGMGSAYDDPHEAMMAAIEDMVSDDYPRSNNYSNYLGTLDIVEGVQEEPSISS
jgi:hypothetical protein